MAIAVRESRGTWQAGTGNGTVNLPTHATGDIIIVRVGYKSSAIATCAASTPTSGWAKLGTEFHDGTTNSGNGTGSVAVAVFWKIAESAAETTPTIEFSQTVTQREWTSVSYQKGGSETWDTPVGDGGGYTASTSVSATIQSHVSVTAGDMVDFFYHARDDTVCTVPTITQASVTFDTVTEAPVTAVSNTSGDDGAADGGYRLATSGTSSAAAVVTGTQSTSESGSAWMTRLRVTSAARVPYSTPYPQLLPR